MCVYCKAASTILDTLWEDHNFRAFFYDQNTDLGALGPLTHDIFVPAYQSVKRSLKGGTLEMLEAQVTEDVFGPLVARSHFREMWESLDQRARNAFLDEQSEIRLASLLVVSFAAQFARAYQQAYRAHSQNHRGASPLR
jgi:hypothetical protein